MELVYPAIFVKESVGGYYVQFPDIEGAGTQGNNVTEALSNASDYLGLMLADYIEDEETLPKPSSPSEIEKRYSNESTFTSLVSVNIDEYIKDTQFIRTTITLPKWIKRRSEVLKLNVSEITAEALKEKIM